LKVYGGDLVIDPPARGSGLPSPRGTGAWTVKGGHPSSPGPPQRTFPLKKKTYKKT